MRNPFHHWIRIAIFALALVGAFSAEARHLAAQNSATTDPISPPGRRTYMGRTIAPTMGAAGAGWLIRETREEEERPSEVIRQLNLKPGMVVCDLGCGNGFYTLKMAELVAPGGKVLAVDIQPEMLHLLQLRCQEAGIDNVEPIQSTVTDPKLPPNSVDLVLLVDVYHEFSHPVQMLRGIRESLRPDGVVALLEYRAEDPTVPIRPLHKMSKRQILKEYHANGFRLVRQYDGLPWQHLMFFARDPDWHPPQFSSGDDE
ncbi:MAG: class I SAM-dependent methyltransferase [Planctomycetota bacterium]|nr:MAG: class I SAM-dependent methyltransferase [Planctomycetota bacterium]